jgi:hypothetical protein
MNIHKMTLIILVIISFSVICACNSSLKSVQPTATQPGMFDTWHTFDLWAWQDIDGDGLWSVSEFPLEGVRFDIIAGPVGEAWGYPPITNAQGLFDWIIWHPGGGTDDETYTITAQPPESYQPTTPPVVTFSIKTNEIKYELQFGFCPVLKK